MRPGRGRRIVLVGVVACALVTALAAAYGVGFARGSLEGGVEAWSMQAREYERVWEAGLQGHEELRIFLAGQTQRRMSEMELGLPVCRAGVRNRLKRRMERAREFLDELERDPSQAGAWDGGPPAGGLTGGAGQGAEVSGAR